MNYMASLLKAVFASARRKLTRFSRVVSLALLAIVTTIAASGFFVAALYIRLAIDFGASSGALFVGGGLSFIALLAVAATVWLAKPQPSLIAPPPAEITTTDMATLMEIILSPARASDSVGLLAGIPVANRFKPVELAGLALVAGFLIGECAVSRTRPGLAR